MSNEQGIVRDADVCAAEDLRRRESRVVGHLDSLGTALAVPTFLVALQLTFDFGRVSPRPPLSDRRRRTISTSGIALD